MTTYLKRINYRPNEAGLSAREAQQLHEHFSAYGAEAVVNGVTLPWSAIEEVEVAVAARSRGPAGWLVKNLVMGGERYHVGLYFDRDELVVTNISREIAKYIVESVAYYASQTVRYTGPDDLAPTTDSDQGDQ